MPILRSTPIAPALERWRDDAPSTSERTVIVRTSPAHDLASLAEALREAGVDVRSSGPGVSTVRVRPDSLDRLAQVRGVIAIEEPKEFFPKAGFFKGL